MACIKFKTADVSACRLLSTA